MVKTIYSKNGNQEERSILETGNKSFQFTLPKDWIRFHNLKKGDKLNIVAFEDRLVISVSDQKTAGKKSRRS